MAKYLVNVGLLVYVSVEVEADSGRDAIEAAEEQVGDEDWVAREMAAGRTASEAPEIFEVRNLSEEEGL